MRNMRTLASPRVAIITTRGGQDMDKDYKAMECARCHKLNIVLTEEAEDTKRRGKELRCIHCGCCDLPVLDKFAGVCECMQAGEIDLSKL